LSQKFPFCPTYPAARKVPPYLVAIPASYLVECAFIWVTYLLPQVRNRLDAVKRDDLSHISGPHDCRTFGNLRVLISLEERTE